MYDDSDQSFLSSEWQNVGFFLSCVTTPKGSMSFVECDERLLSILDPSWTGEDSNGAAMWRYFFGHGEPMELGFMAKNALETSFRQLQAEANIIAGTTAI